MNIQADLDWIHKELETVQDPTLVQAIKKILQYRKNVTSERISVEQYNKEIDMSITQIKKGKTYTHQEIGEHIKRWGEK